MVYKFTLVIAVLAMAISLYLALSVVPRRHRVKPPTAAREQLTLRQELGLQRTSPL